MHRLILLRHGQSVWNAEDRFTGWTDVGLTDRGIAETHKAADLLKAAGIDVDIAFTSVLSRAIETLHWQHEPDEAVLAIPLMTSRRAIGTLYVLGWPADEPSEGLAGLEGIAAAGALAIERMVLPAPGDQ